MERPRLACVSQILSGIFQEAPLQCPRIRKHAASEVLRVIEEREMAKRHEIKIAINDADAVALRQRLRLVARYDEHAAEGGYLVRSLYFDTLNDRALRDKLDSVGNREKFRIRCYDRDFSFIQLEKKTKSNGLGEKKKAVLSADEVARLLAGDLTWMNDPSRPVVVELLSKMRSQGLRPKVVVEYRREPFVFGPGNVRVTLDSDVRTGLRSTAFLDPGLTLVPVPGNQRGVLEVKWDTFLPDIIRDAVQLDGRRSSSFSKYAAARMYD